VFLVAEVAGKQQRLPFCPTDVQARENEADSNATEMRHDRRMHDRGRIVEMVELTGMVRALRHA
jgi:hypothetical protein